MQKIRLLIVDEHLNVQTQLAARLRREHDLEVVGQCSSCLQVMEKIVLTDPHILLVDPINRTGVCLDILRQVKDKFPAVVMIILTAIVDTALQVDLKKIGINQILTKGVESAELIATIANYGTYFH